MRVVRADYDRERAYIRRCRAYGHWPYVEHFTTPQLVERNGWRAWAVKLTPCHGIAPPA